MTATPTVEMPEAWVSGPDDCPVALYFRQTLVPVEGRDGVIYPPTYADIGYSVDTLANGTKIATIDSVGSQANRMEPLFKRGRQAAHLVPQIEIAYQASGNKTKFVSLLDAGHRLGDAIVRCSALGGAAKEAFEAYDEADDARPIARLAPTSLVFGAWDSRQTLAKLPRIVQSVIRAHDVDELHRAAQYEPAVNFVKEGLLAKTTQKAENDKRSSRGFQHAPAIWRDDKRTKRILGGIIANGPIQRDVTVNLIALNRLNAGGEDPKPMRRYLLGLALVAATAPMDLFLRSGCLLVPDIETPATWATVARDGHRHALDLTAARAMDWANAAKGFVTTWDHPPYAFDPKAMAGDLKASD